MGNGNTKRKGLAVVAAVRANVRLTEMLGGPAVDRKNREKWKHILERAPDRVREKRAKMPRNRPEEKGDVIELSFGAVPPKRNAVNSREVRIFVSSTFSDMKTERDLFMEDVYPYLRELCRRLGYTFTAGDLRWGVRDEMTDEHQAVEICLTEMAICKKESVGPFLICIMGERYGFRPIPVKINQDLFESFLDKVKDQSGEGDGSDHSLLNKWYRLDKNNNPPRYILQRISTYYPCAYRNNGQIGNEEAKRKEQGDWFREFERMRNALRKAAISTDFSKFHGAKLQEHDFQYSVTHFELEAALDDFNSNIDNAEIENRVFIFKRSYKPGTTTGTLNLSRAFTDRDASGRIDSEAQELLQNMENMCRSVVPSKYIYQYALSYDLAKDGRIDITTNKEQLAKLCDEICQLMVDSIIDAVASKEVCEDSLYQEVLNQLVFCQHMTSSFFGRENILEKIQTYLKRENGSRPLVIYGVSGSGKTSIAAKAFTQSAQAWEVVDVGRPIHIIRFLGTTPHSSNVRSLLASICAQLKIVFKDESTTIADDFDRLVATFQTLLRKATPEKPLVLFLDSLDQLSDQDDGRALRWLPAALPKNVHVIVSTLSMVGGCLAALKSKMSAESNSRFYIEVPTLETKDVEGILDMRLRNSNRYLTPQQRKTVLDASSKPTALFVKLACDTALSWHSYTRYEDAQLQANATEMIESLFKRLELVHGGTLVRHALGFITASRTGLTRAELEDILSCDDLVLDDHVFKYHVPPVRRLPPLLWTRLRNDLGSYLVEVAADGHVVYRWYHRLFLEAARGYFLSDKPFAEILSVELANYFLGRWANYPKPYTDQSGQRRSAFRWVAAQPLVLSTSGGSDNRVMYNLRKLSEMTHHLTRAEMWNELVENVCQMSWIEAKCRTGRAYELTAELAEASLRCTTERAAELEDFYSYVRANAELLSQFPGLVVQQALNERDSSYCAAKAQAYLTRPGNNDLQPCWADLTKSDIRTPDMSIFKHPAPVTTCVLSKGCKYLATYGEDSMLRVFLVASGSVVMTTGCQCKQIAFPKDDDPTWVAAADTHSIVRYALGRGTASEGAVVQKWLVDSDIDERSKITIIQKGFQWEVCLATCQGKVRCYSTSKKSGDKPVFKEDLPKKPKVVCFSEDGKTLAYLSDKIYVTRYKEMKDVKALDTEKKVSPNLVGATLVFNTAATKLCAVLGDGTYFWALSSGKLLKSLAIRCIGTAFTVVSSELDYIATPAERDANDLSVFCMAPKPYDKSPEWETLSGHSSPITWCAIGTRPNGRPLLATSSRDSTVQLWDTKHMPVPKNSQKIPDHSTEVLCCALSPDCTLAVTRTATELWVWDATCAPIRKLHHLDMPANSERSNIRDICFSDDGEFIVAPVPTGLDVWHLKTGFDLSGVDSSMIRGLHRIHTLLANTHLLTMFTSEGLYSSFVTDTERHCLRVFLSINNEVFSEWRQHVKGDPPPSLDNDAPFEDRVYVEESERVVAARMTSSADKIAALVLPQSSRSQALSFSDGPVSLYLWTLPEKDARKVELSQTSSPTYDLIFMGQYLLVMTQEENTKQEKMVTMVTLSNQASSQRRAGVIRVVDENAKVLDSSKTPGNFNQMLELPNEPKLSERLLIAGITDGTLTIRYARKDGMFGEFGTHQSDVTAVGLGRNGSSIVLGCSNGKILILKRFQS